MNKVLTQDALIKNRDAQLKKKKITITNFIYLHYI